jgi:hypothetical protein
MKIYNENVVGINQNKITVDDLLHRFYFTSHLQKRLQAAHDLLLGPLMAVKDTLLESIWVKVFHEDLCLGEELLIGKKKKLLFGWQPNSHQVGKDLQVPSLELADISSKAGKLSDDEQFVTISSSRMQEYKTIEDKLRFFETKHEDVIYSLASNLKEGYYLFSIIESPGSSLASLSWSSYVTKSRCGRHEYTNWIGTPTEQQQIKSIKEANIRGSMSDQLWFDVNLDSDIVLHKEKIQIKF